MRVARRYSARYAPFRGPGAARAARREKRTNTNRRALYTFRCSGKDYLRPILRKRVPFAVVSAYGAAMSWRNSTKAAPEEPPFRLQSVSRTASPEGSEGDWYRYVIAQGTNLITGMRAGDEAEIQRALNDMVERLNERRMGKNRSKAKTATRAPAAAAAPPAQTTESHA